MITRTYGDTVVEFGEIATRRNLPFTQETLDGLRAIRAIEEDKYYDTHGEDVIIPMPVAIDLAVKFYLENN
jgi:hypothetical protein